MLMFVTSISTVLTSCKKDEKTDKEKATEFLTSGKWYYQSFKNGDYSQDCFTESDYWEFKADGNFEESTELGKGTYTVNDDAKSFSVKISDQTYNGTIVNIDDNSLKLTLSYEGQTIEFTLAKTAKNCRV
ncbi:hypothetical protein D3C87_1189890 [compost metagenome]